MAVFLKRFAGWFNKTETDSSLRDGVPSEERAWIKAMERENKELRQVNDILRIKARTTIWKVEKTHRCHGSQGTP